MADVDPDFLFEAAADNPSLVAAAERVIAGSDDVEEPPKVEEPTDGKVTLPGGFRRVRITDTGTKFEPVTTAWVRELNGEDEERIAKARLTGDPEDFMKAILVSGVERLGDEKPTSDDLSSLLLGDREYLLLEISRATYGDKIDYEKMPCPVCGDTFDLSVSLSEEIPVSRLKNVDESSFEIRISKDRVAHVRLPSVAVAVDLAEAETAPEADTAVIAHSVTTIKGGVGGDLDLNGDKDLARKLTMRDRKTIVDELYRRMPGPDYNGVRFDHEPGCGKEVRLQITLADLFRTL